MFTQFFGNYLLNRQLVSPEHLSEVFESVRDSRLKLGVLAMNAGLMTAAQVEKAHSEQKKVDKRIGSVMIDMGYITNTQLEELLKAQPAGHLLLGQALVDNGYMTTSQFEKALNSYKAENGFAEALLASGDDALDSRLVKNFYSFPSAGGSGYITGYVSLLFKNLIRFIGADFTPMDAHALMGMLTDFVSQRIEGGLNAITLIDGDSDTMVEFASRFANEQFTEENELTRSSISRFISLNNSLFAYNLEQTDGIRLKLEPQDDTETIDLQELSNACVIPVNFSFGTVNFIISM